MGVSVMMRLVAVLALAHPILASIHPSALLFLPLPGLVSAAGLVGAKLLLGVKLLHFLGSLHKNFKPPISLSHHHLLHSFPLPSALPHPFFYGHDYFAPQHYLPGFPVGYGLSGMPPVHSFGTGGYSWVDDKIPLKASPRQKDFKMFDIKSATPEQIESFFTILLRLDAKRCISRLVCEIGANPKNLEGLGDNVRHAIGTLKHVEKGSKAQVFKSILENGQRRGKSSCIVEFSECDDHAFGIIKSFAKAVRIPKNIRRV